MKPTKNQQQFLDQHQSNVLVSASAGCGKTTTMIQKLIQLILREGIKVKELLVVTFTNAAGAEMKQKLYKALYQTILQEDLTEDEKNALIDQLEDIGQADIGTLHSICKKIIEKYFYTIDMDPQFVIIEGNEQQYLLTKAVQNVLSSMDHHDTVFENLYEYFNKKRKNESFMNTLIQLYGFLSSKTDQKEWETYILDHVYVEDMEHSVVIQYLLEYFLEKFEALLLNAQKLYEESVILGLEKYQNSLLDVIHFLKDIQNVTSIKVLDQKIQTLDTKSIRVRTPKNLDPDYIDFVTTYQEFIGETKKVNWDSVRGTLAGYKKYVQLEKDKIDFDVMQEQTKQVKVLVQKLFELEDKVSQEYQRLKKDRNGLDFNDLEQKTLEILSYPEAQKEIMQSYKAIFVDEYQDINEVQESIITRLKTNVNLYMIGDVKQSIYGFRHCTPTIFLQKAELFQLDGKKNVLLGLNDNFRSHNNILEFVNAVCKKLMTKKTIGIDYEKESMLQSGNDAQRTPQDQNVILHIIEKDDLEKDDVIRSQAKAVMKYIVSKIGKPYFNIATQQYETLDYKHFAVLTRNKTELVEEIYNLLTENNIPVSASFNSSLFHTEEIGTLVAFLKVLQNSRDEISLVSILTSPMIQCTEDELVMIKQDPKKSYYDNMRTYQGEDQVAKKLQQLWSLLDTYREKLQHKTVVETLQDLIRQYDLENYYGTLPDGISRVNRIRLFLNIISNDSTKYALEKVVEYIDLLSSQEKFEISVATQENAVQMMTMHKSKGLEFPCVILAGLSTNFNEDSARKELVVSNRFSIGLRCRDMNKRTESNHIIRSACLLHTIEEERKEEIRLLYVAMTRAKNTLIMIGCKKANQTIIKQPLQCRSHLEMILSTIPVAVQENFSHQKQITITLDQSTLTIQNEKKEEDEEFLQKQQKPILPNYDHDLYEKLHTLCVQNDELVEEDPIALKNTVSQMLMDEQEDYTQVIETPTSFAISESSMATVDGSQLGTAYHKVMEKMDFDFGQNAQKIVEQLYASGQINLPIKNQINIQKIERAVVQISQLITPDSQVYKEAQFMYKDKHCNLVKNSTRTDAILIQGMVDLFIKQGNIGILVDYKTNKNISPDDLKKKYAKQLELYALAIKEAYHLEKVEQYIYSFEYEKLLKVSS